MLITDDFPCILSHSNNQYNLRYT